MLKPYWTNGIATLYEADARALPLADKSVHCCVTSPPYWGLRDYGLGKWQGGDAECGHEGTLLYGIGGSEKQRSNLGTVGGDVGPCQYCGATKEQPGIGLEPTLGEWVANIVAVGREVRRVLRDDGSFWLNLGDAYTSGNGGDGGRGTENGGVMHKLRRGASATLPAKNLMGQPWRVAFALQDDGWILRSAIVWHKPNPMPESVTDRPTNAYEMVFLLAKQGKYFYDAEAVREATKPYGGEHTGSANGKQAKALSEGRSEVHSGKGMMSPNYERPTSANARNVWTIPTQGRPDAHFATFPDELPRRCILAGTSERGVCADCGAPWVRSTEVTEHVGHKPRLDEKRFKGGSGPHPSNTVQQLGWQPTCGCNADCPHHGKEASRPADKPDSKSAHTPRNDGDRWNQNAGGGFIPNPQETTGWQASCTCGANVIPATVLDCFAGSGTTLAVAQSLGRASVGTDLNREYLDIASKRIGNVSLPLPLDLQPTTDYQTSFQEAQE